MERDIYDFINVILNVILVLATVAGVIFASFQLWQIKTNRKRQFEQSRREKTVEMIIHYAKGISKETKTTEKIVAKLNDEQCQDLYNCTPFTISQNIAEQICAICPQKLKCKANGKGKPKLCQDKDGNYWIKDKMLYFLRGNIVSYLNSLETVMLAWQLGIVDQKAIEEQFLFLDKKRQRERALETFRTIAGNGHSYPAIEKFYQHLDMKRRKNHLKVF